MFLNQIISYVKTVISRGVTWTKLKIATHNLAYALCFDMSLLLSPNICSLKSLQLYLHVFRWKIYLFYK